MLESEDATIFVREYKNLPDGRMELHPFTMLFLPRDRPPGGAAAPPGNEGRAVVLEAPQGAVLQFDERFDLKRAKLGKLIGGDLTGPIHIHNAPPAPGAADELDIRTRDVKLVGDKIVTPNVVDFRFGPNVGTGRDMVILLGRKEGAAANDNQAVAFDGMRNFTLLRDVKMRMQLGDKGLMPGAAKPSSANAPSAVASAKPPRKNDTAKGGATKNNPPKNDPPVEVTCQGPFRFDVVHNVATFTEQVNVLKLDPVGPSDSMRCEMLAIYFVERQPPPKPGEPIEPPPTKQRADKPRETADANQLSKLEPRLIEARGEPVIVYSPSNGGHARCQRLEYDLPTGTIHLEDAKEVLLNQGPNEIRCKRLDYQPPKVGRLGRLTAIGPGTLQGFPEGDPIHKYQARWSNRLTMQPEGPLSLVSLLGDAQMRMTDTGSLSAEEIFIWVSEAQPPPGAAPPAPPKGGPPGTEGAASGIQVERLMARRRVRIDSPQLTGDTSKLEVWINRPAAAAPAPAAAPGAAPAPAPPVAAAPPPPPKQAAQPGAPGQRFDVSGGALRMKVAANGPAMAVSEVDVDENARFLETKTAAPGDKPLLVRGNNLHISAADTPNAHVVVSGKPGYVEARGMTLSGAIIQMERGANRLWVDGAGRMTLPMQGQLAAPRGQAGGTAKPPREAPRAQAARRSPATTRNHLAGCDAFRWAARRVRAIGHGPGRTSKPAHPVVASHAQTPSRLQRAAARGQCRRIVGRGQRTGYRRLPRRCATRIARVRRERTRVDRSHGASHAGGQSNQRRDSRTGTRLAQLGAAVALPPPRNHPANRPPVERPVRFDPPGRADSAIRAKRPRRAVRAGKWASSRSRAPTRTVAGCRICMSPSSEI